MGITAFVAQARDHYVNQFAAFADKQKRGCTHGASELKLQLSEAGAIFQNLYCVDFLKKDERIEIIELQPGRFLKFDVISGSFGAAAVSIEHLRWDDLVIYHDVPVLPEEKIAQWFRLWFDPHDERHDREAALSGIIHSLYIRPGVVSVDFGTSPPDAFWDMLELLEGAGASTIRVSSSRAEAELDELSI
jgi:hypothetical protein